MLKSTNNSTFSPLLETPLQGLSENVVKITNM